MDVIIGAGISGLSYAFFKNNDDYIVFEKDDTIGGYCRTTKRNEFVWDYSGHFFHFQSQDMKELITENLSSDDIVKVNKKTYIKYKDKLIDYPFQKNIHQLDKDEFIECLVDLFEADKSEYKNFKEMLYCKFGTGISEKFLIPYNEKLYACDLNILDKDAMGRFFPYADKKDIILNFKSHKNNSYNDTFSYPRNGAIEYINEIADKLDSSRININSEISRIELEDKNIILTTGEKIHYDNLISTVPFPKLLDLCSIKYNADYYSWNKVLVFNIGFDSKSHITDKHWIYFPEKEYCFYRVGFYDNILNQDRTSVYVEIGFNKDDIINADDWYERVLDDLLKAELITEEQKVIDYETVIMNPAYVHITNDSIRDVAEKKELLKEYDVYSIGRYGSWTYCSIEDNMKEAKSLAEQLSR